MIEASLLSIETDRMENVCVPSCMVWRRSALTIIVAKRHGYESKRMVDMTKEMTASKERFNKGKPVYAAKQ
jgi:hypothetical protein